MSKICVPVIGTSLIDVGRATQVFWHATAASMLYGITIFLSAFLLFQLELICAKRLLPWFGGSPSVWATCQVFFQVTLLAGYAYAHYLASRGKPRRQSGVHVTLLAGSIAVLAASALWAGVPLLAPDSLKPTGTEQPIPLLLWILVSTAGIPFLALSATGPLLQHWHSQSGAPLDRTYRLYAFSNAGSLLGLLSYPFGIERVLDLNAQAWVWTGLFVAFALGCAALARRWSSLPHADPAITQSQGAAAGAQAGGTTISARLLPWIWVILAFTSSALFLATTNHLCQEVAVVPFLWVLPLAVYLLTFIICFERPRWYSRRWCVTGAVLSSAIIFLQKTVGVVYIPAQIFEYALNLLFLCMICHGELFRLRPVASKITIYYLLIATGGALGGGFVSLAAPALFVGFWEFPVMMLLAWLAFGAVWILDKTSEIWVPERSYFAPTVGLVSFVLAPFAIVITPVRRLPWLMHNVWPAAIGAAVAAALLVGVVASRGALARRTLWFRSLLVLMLILGAVSLRVRIHDFRVNTVYAARNFFGLVRVVAIHNGAGQVAAYELMHNLTIHGVEFTSPDARDLPTTYYSPSTGIGVAARALETRFFGAQQNFKIGILGLGVGTIASYAHAGDDVRIYEIDPIVMDVAGKEGRYFSFVRDCEGRVSIVPGDARVSLEREFARAGSQTFDLLVLDAFSGDAIPVHLLTEEAFRLYRAHLRDASSILALHVTNGRLNLEPVVAASASKLGFNAIVVDSDGDGDHWPEPSSWILLAREKTAFDQPSIQASDHRPLGSEAVLFTDRYSNLFRVLK
jgi:hypothetical protein